MLPRDKRATLSSNLLAAKDGSSASEEATPPARAPARRSALREAIEEIREAAKQEQTGAKQKSKYEPQPPKQETLPEPPPVPTASPEIEDDTDAGGGVLYSKGDASAAGFRPWYWSYERDGTPPTSDSAGTVTPLRASAPSPATSSGPVSAPATVDDRKRRPVLLLAGIAGVVVIAAAGGAWFALSSSSPPFSSPLSHQEIATAPISEPAPEPPAARVPPPLPRKPAVVDAAPAPPAPPPAPAVIAPPPAPPVAAAPAPPAAPPPAASTPASPEAAEFMKRGDDMLATGDIASARLFYERAAEQGHPAAALALGKTYDPLFLEEVRARGIRGDAAQAAKWYRKAAASGDPQASIRLQHLLAKYPG